MRNGANVRQGVENNADAEELVREWNADRSEEEREKDCEVERSIYILSVATVESFSEGNHSNAITQLV